jgi:hypothetical protein
MKAIEQGSTTDGIERPIPVSFDENSAKFFNSRNNVVFYHSLSGGQRMITGILHLYVGVGPGADFSPQGAGDRREWWRLRRAMPFLCVLALPRKESIILPTDESRLLAFPGVSYASHTDTCIFRRGALPVEH